MKAYILVKIKENKNPGATTTGDIVTVYPIDVPQAKLDINDFLYVVVDLKIPCGDNFRAKTVNEVGSYRCNRCKYNDYELCDVINYTRAVWSSGSLKNKPEIIKGRRFFIDRTSFISAESDVLVINDNKSEVEKTLSFQKAQNNEQPKSVITEKQRGK